MNLYEIDKAILELVDEETGEIADWDAFEQLQMEREQKIENAGGSRRSFGRYNCIKWTIIVKKNCEKFQNQGLTNGKRYGILEKRGATARLEQQQTKPEKEENQMKKILSVVMACILMVAVAVPAFSANALEAVTQVGAWPQSRITEPGELACLEDMLWALDPVWQEDTLPNGRPIAYTDVNMHDPSLSARERPEDRVVRMDGELLWYRWEPLEWKYLRYREYDLWVCTSVVFAVENNADVFRTWLKEDFYRTAFTRAEQRRWMIAAPTYGITQNAAASVGDYARLYKADGRKYYQRTVPFELGEELLGFRVVPIQSSIIGVRPIITASFVHTHTTSRAFGLIRCFLCWLFH